MTSPQIRIAVIGHVEYVVIARVPALPQPGEILHLDEPLWIPGGGGGITFAQLAKSPAELHLFTAFGDDDAAADARARVEEMGATIHAADRESPQTRDVVLLTPNGERTIVVVGRPLHATLDDPLDWSILDGCRAVFFSAEDPRLLRRARAAEILVVTARRQEAIAGSGDRGGRDRRQRVRSARSEHARRLRRAAEGARDDRRRCGRAHRDGARRRRGSPAPPAPPVTGAAYGAGDSFVGALTWYLACGLSVEDACVRAGPHGAAVLRGINPLETQLPLTSRPA